MNITEQHQRLLQNVAVHLAYQQEHWFTSGKSNVCPLCQDLEDLGWVPYGTLPAYKHAHSVIGKGNWKVGDEYCNCTKGYKRVKGDSPLKQSKFSSVQDARDAVRDILERHKDCKCK